MMKIVATGISGVAVAETNPMRDGRGTFTRLFCERDLASVLHDSSIVQINHSQTSAVGSVRGLHFQLPPCAEMKLIRCLKGKAWDVAVDIRTGSPTFLRWYATELTPENALMMIVPEGCAHGFQALAPDTELLYLHTAAYHPHAEGGIAWNDPRLRIAWPLVPPAENGISERDRKHPPLAADFVGIRS